MIEAKSSCKPVRYDLFMFDWYQFTPLSASDSSNCVAYSRYQGTWWTLMDLHHVPDIWNPRWLAVARMVPC